MPEVKRPKPITLGEARQIKVVAERMIRSRCHVVVVIWNGTSSVVTADDASRLSSFFAQVSVWARTLEPEFDERNE